MFTAEFEEFVQPARPRAQIWRLLVGLVLMSFIYLVGIAAVFGFIWLTAGTLGVRLWAGRLVEASSPTGTLLLMATFAGMALAPLVTVRVVHRRRPRTLFGPRDTVRHDFIVAATAVFCIYGALTAGWVIIFDAVPNLDPVLWATFLPIALLGVLVQTGAEELVFRGYLQQQLGARFNSPIAWMILPSIAFGMVHFSPDKTGANTWFVVIAATVYGLVAADLTRLTGSIGASWGFHFANNVFAVLVLAVQGTVPGLALYLTPYAADDGGMLPAIIVADFSGLLVGWLAVRRLLRR